MATVNTNRNYYISPDLANVLIKAMNDYTDKLARDYINHQIKVEEMTHEMYLLVQFKLILEGKIDEADRI